LISEKEANANKLDKNQIKNNFYDQKDQESVRENDNFYYNEGNRFKIKDLNYIKFIIFYIKMIIRRWTFGL